jgi:hypothetical protein
MERFIRRENIKRYRKLLRDAKSLRNDRSRTTLKHGARALPQDHPATWFVTGYFSSCK